jgi:hypothetical protein
MSERESALASRRIEFLWDRIANYIETNSFMFSMALCVCFAGLSLVIAARRPFWFDEILTVSVARAPTIRDLLADFRLGYDQTPPLSALLVRFACFLFGWSEFAARLPSAMFAAAGLFLVFHRVRTLTNGLFGLVAISALTATCLPTYAYEARPYAMLFFASVFSVWCWTSKPSDSAESSTAMSLLFGLALIFGVIAHYYGVLLILPFVISELRSRGVRRLISFRLACGIFGTAAGLLVQLPFVWAAAQSRPTPFWAAPSFQGLQRVYVEMLVQFIFALVCAILLVSWSRSYNTNPVARQSSHERLGWFFLGIPIAGYILAEIATHAFTGRYFISLLAGFGVAFGCFLYRYCYNSPRVPLLLLSITLLLFVEAASSHIRYAGTHAISNRTEEADFADEMLPRFRAEGKRFVLLPIGRSYLEASYYAADPDMIRVFLPPNYPRWFLTQSLVTVHYFSVNDLRRYARETAFIAPSPDVLSDLVKLGFHIEWRIIAPEAVVYAE